MQLAVKFTTLDVSYMTRLSITRLPRKQTANSGSYLRRVRTADLSKHCHLKQVCGNICYVTGRFAFMIYSLVSLTPYTHNASKYIPIASFTLQSFL